MKQSNGAGGPSDSRSSRTSRTGARVRCALHALLVPLLLVAPLAARASAAPAGDPPGEPGDPRAPLAGAQPTISLDEVRVGQRGYGLSVFAGGEPQRFDVEVIGVWRNVSPDMSYILARLSGREVERTGVAAGMSGSPVFLDGRLAGALSFGWPFSKEAICGITPIASMRRLSTLGGPLPTSPPPPVKLASLLAGEIPGELLQRELARLKPRLGGTPEGALASVEWSAAGFGELSQGIIRQALGSVAPSGRVAPGVEAGLNHQDLHSKNPRHGPPARRLQPGSAVSAVLVDGDFQLAATGTVTDQFGDHVLAFGHQFLGLGPVRLPMARSEVVTVLSSQYTSFKIANLGETVGAFVQDRQAGIEGRLGEVAPMIPVRLRVESAGAPGGKVREFKVRLAELPELVPALAGSTLLAALESASYTAGPQSLDLTARFRLSGHGELAVEQTFDGESAGPASANYLVAIASFLTQNTLERVEIEGLDIDLRQAAQPRAAALVGAHAERSVVRPGETIRLEVDLVAYRGERFRHSLSLRLPDDLPAGRYSVLVGDGASGDAARLALEPAEPVTFAQALALLRSLHSRRDLTVLGVYAGPGLSVAGEVMPRLPGSVRSWWSAAPTGNAVPLRMTVAQERHELLARPMDGLVRVELEVRRKDAVSPSSAPAAGARGERSERQRGTAAAPAAGSAPPPAPQPPAPSPQNNPPPEATSPAPGAPPAQGEGPADGDGEGAR